MKPYDSLAIAELAQALGNALFDNSVMRPRPRTHHELREWLRDYFDRAATLDAGGDELCGCGRPAEYSTNDGGRCCNKYGVRCPPAPAGDAVAGLVGKWRERATPSASSRASADFLAGRREAYEQCADELAAALQSSGREGGEADPYQSRGYYSDEVAPREDRTGREGMVLVPERLTEDMREALNLNRSEPSDDLYAAILAAAQEPNRD
jgi:hypothetical protein